MSTTRTLKPRSTIDFQNQQKSRLRPNENETNPDTGVVCGMWLGMVSTELEETVTRVRNVPSVHALPVVAEDIGGGSANEGERMGNKTFTLQGGAVPRVGGVQTPIIMAMIVIDANNSILSNGGDGLITITYTDDTDTGRVDTLQLSVDGLGYFETSFPVKSVTSVIGTLFDAAGAGSPAIADTFWMGPRMTDTVHEIVRGGGSTTGGPVGDPNDSQLDSDGSYVEADNAADQRVYVKVLDPVAQGQQLLSITNVSISMWTKNVGNPAGTGITMTFRTDPAQLDWPLVSNDATSTEGGFSTLSSSSLSINPRTGVAWTVQEVRDLEVGVIFTGESGPTVPKRLNFIRVFVSGRSGFYHPTIDGSILANQSDEWQAVSKDPFTTPTGEDAQHVRIMTNGSQEYMVGMESLPADALDPVTSVESFVRLTIRNVAHPFGNQINDWPCGTGAQPQSNPNTLSWLNALLEQTNIGGWRGRIRMGSTADDPIRQALGVGDPAGGCGSFSNYDGFDAGYGNYVESSHLVTVDGATPITVADVNGMRCGLIMNEFRSVAEHRISRIYAQVLWDRKPTGSSFFHLVVDDDPSAPNDSDFMESQNDIDRDFSVDFSGIPEVTAINSVTATVRAKTGPGGSAGWRMLWRTNATDFAEPVQLNESFSNVPFVRALNPVTGDPWTREEVNQLVIVWRAEGENDYVPKQISLVSLEVDFDEIPAKIDNARDIASRKLRFRRKPAPFLKAKLPLQFLDIGLLGDMQVVHRAIPRTEETIGFEVWDRTPFRVFKESEDLNRQVVELTSFDLRDYLNTLWITGRTRTKGQAAEGMAVMTPGVSLGFERATNDYFPSPAGTLVQELNADVPPTGPDGILVLNGVIERLVNNHFAEGATDVFTEWSQNGLPASGASIVEDVVDVAFEQFIGAPARSVLMTGATTPADIFLEQLRDVPAGDLITPVPGAWYTLSVEHKDDSGEPLSIAVRSQPAGFSERFYRFADNTWQSSGGDNWITLPIASVRRRDRVGIVGNMDALTQSPAQDDLQVKIRIATRTTADQQNHVYGVSFEGGTIDALEDQFYQTNRVLTKTGPVVRDPMGFSVPVRSTLPAYPANLRGTTYWDVVPLWDGAQLPLRSGVRRYVYGLIINADNSEECYYDSDTDSFVYTRKIAGIEKSVSVFFPAVVAGVPIRVATRWISNVGELDEPPFSIQLFVNNIESNVESFTQGHSLPSESFLFIGSRDGTDGEMFDGFFRDITIKQFALPFDAIKRLP